jgi:hypothetical protein
MDLNIGSVIGGNTIKYLLIGAVAVVVPTLVSSFLKINGWILALGLVVGGVMLMGKVPVLPQALIAGAGILILSPMISSALSGVTSAVSTATSSTPTGDNF